jgi:hypothetical protein
MEPRGAQAVGMAGPRDKRRVTGKLNINKLGVRTMSTLRARPVTTAIIAVGYVSNMRFELS